MEKWNKEEIKILKNNYGIKSRDYLCKILFNRTWSAIRTKAAKLKLTYPTCEERFWKYVDKRSDYELCWNWTGYCNHQGYGSIKVNGKMILAHRFSWILHIGTISKNKTCVLHKCDNPMCVNPTHLWLGTREDNTKDRDNKDRQAKGEKHGKAKLTFNKVKKIRNLKNKLTITEIAKIFDINDKTVRDIYKKRTWKHL